MGWNHLPKKINGTHQFQGLLAKLLMQVRRKKTQTIAAIDAVALCVQKKG
jgi:hypothetical protein